MANNNGGPWGGGNRGGGGDDRRPGEQGQIPEIDEIVKKGQEQLKVLMGGRGGSGGGGQEGGQTPPANPRLIAGLVIVVLLGAWLWNSLYRVEVGEQGVELLFGEYFATTNDGLNFAPYPFITYEIVQKDTLRSEDIGTDQRGQDNGLMLTTDENIVDIDFQVVWNVSDAAKFLFTLAEPEETVRAVSESAMREVIAARQLAPILNRDRGIIADNAEELIQATLNSYDSGINIVRITLDKADPPAEVIGAFRDVQAAEQERDRLERQADAYANRALASARGEAAQLLEEAEAYRAQVVNEAQGEASRFTSVLEEYVLAPDVTRKRLYLETMERVLGNVDKVILDPTISGEGGQGVVPYLPLTDLNRSNARAQTTTTGSN